MQVHLIVAMTPEGVIGKDNQLPWEIPSDLKRFRRLTLGHPVIMGATTFLGIVERLGHPLEGRMNLVLTSKRTREVQTRGGIAVPSPEKALAIAQNQHPRDPFVIGGASIYERFLPHCDILHLTTVQTKLEGDARFPDLNLRKWKPPMETVALTLQDPKDQHPTSYAEYHR